MNAYKPNENKIIDIVKAFLWGILILIFPISSGILSVIWNINTVGTLFLQGFFMLISLIPPIILIVSKKWKWNEIGLGKLDKTSCKEILFLLPILFIFLPVALDGFYIKSVGYMIGSLFLYFNVGLAEEIYFRGIIPRYLYKSCTEKEIILISTIIFAVGHIAAAFTGASSLEIGLTLFNAFIFGWMAIEIRILVNSVIPVVFIHFFFDFETKIIAMSGSKLVIAEAIRGALMFLVAIWLAMALKKKSKRNSN